LNLLKDSIPFTRSFLFPPKPFPHSHRIIGFSPHGGARFWSIMFFCDWW
jgi:hypothetical protein